MKQITNREGIAKSINFNKYPVLEIDMANKDEFYGYAGSKVRIDFGKDYYLRAELRVYSDKKELTLSQGCTCLSASFGYSDLKEMLEYANAPIIKANEKVLICIYNSETRTAYAPLLVATGNRVDPMCSTPLTFEENDMSWMFE